MDKLKEKEMIKKRPFLKCTWNDWLINYIPEFIKKTGGGFKDKIMSLFKITNQRL